MIALIHCPKLTHPESAWGAGVDTCLMNMVDRPMLQHVLETLSDCGVRTLHVHLPGGNAQREDLLGDGSRWGMNIRVWHGAGDRSHMEAAILDDLRESDGLIVGSGDSLPQLQQLLDAKDRVVGIRNNGSLGEWIILPGYSGIRWVNQQTPTEMAKISTRQATLWLETNTPTALLESQILLLRRHFSTVPLFGLEIKPGVWAARGAKIDSTAVLEGPAYIGPFAMVGADCRIAAGAVIGEGSVVEAGTNVARSCVASYTRVGRRLRLVDVIVVGNILHAVRFATRVALNDRVLASAV